MIDLALSSALTLMMAYLDPGSGSLLIQFLIATFVGIGNLFKGKVGESKKIFQNQIL